MFSWRNRIKIEFRPGRYHPVLIHPVELMLKVLELSNKLIGK
jgi:hypothetical protein